MPFDQAMHRTYGPDGGMSISLTERDYITNLRGEAVEELRNADRVEAKALADFEAAKKEVVRLRERGRKLFAEAGAMEGN